MRAHRVAAGRVPAERAELAPRVVLAHARDLGQRQLAGGGGKEEVLGHGDDTSVASTTDM
jgi:hypothetical protein